MPLALTLTIAIGFLPWSIHQSMNQHWYVKGGKDGEGGGAIYYY